MHKEIYEFLVSNGIDCDYDNTNDVIDIRIKIDEITYELYMKFPLYYPYEFPSVYIKDRQRLTIPHIYTDDKLCLYDDNEVVPNPENYLHDALACILRAKKLLIESKNRCNVLDYQLETVTFWEAKSEGRVDFLGYSDESTRLMWQYEWLDNYYVVADEQNVISNFVSNSYGLKTKDIVFQRALLINIGKSVLVALTSIKDICELIPKNDLVHLYNFLVKNQGKGLIILYADNGMGKCLFSLKLSLLSNGIKIRQRNIRGVLAANKNRNILRLRTRNFQMKRLFTRGGDGTASFDKKCLLVGCGSVGSYISKAIIDVGITDEICLLDNDVLKDENIARHFCGSNHLLFSTSKVEALRNELLKHYPTLKCNAVNENVWKYILKEISFFNQYNILLICVGNTMLEKKIIQMLKNNKIQKECIILWVEPYLVAGHALVFQKSLDTNTEKSFFDDYGMFNNNVLLNSRKYLKSEAGCQSAYAPYAGFEVQKFVQDFVDIYYRKIYNSKAKNNYEFTWIGKMKWARQQNFEIKPIWRAKDDRFMELKRIDN